MRRFKITETIVSRLVCVVNAETEISARAKHDDLIENLSKAEYGEAVMKGTTTTGPDLEIVDVTIPPVEDCIIFEAPSIEMHRAQKKKLYRERQPSAHVEEEEDDDD